MTAPRSISELHRLNGLPATEFTAELGGVFEHSPWVAERVAALRPFATARDLHDAMIGAVRGAGVQQQLDLIRAHPELAGQEAVAGTLTAASASEQSRLGLTHLAREDFNRLADLNRRYRERFGFPCIIALRRHQSLASVLGAFEQRLGNARETEITTALDEIGHITESRLASRLGLAGGRLSTHVLDTSAGGLSLPGRCPKCGDGALFTGPLSLQVVATCASCGLDFAFADPGDGPAIFAIFILGFVVLGGALVVEFKFGTPVWAHLVLWGVLTPILALVLLRWLKARLIGAQYRHRAGEGRLHHD